LVVVLHGNHASADFEAVRTGFLPYVGQGRAVVIYPVGYHESWNVDADNCCHDAAKRGLDDAGFIAAAADDARSWLPTDPARTYLVGFSNGAKLAFDVVCGHSAGFAAFATMASVPLRSCPTSQDSRPVSALMAIGSADPELPLHKDGNAAVPLLDAAGVTWRTRDRCTATAATSRRGIATITDYGGCSAGTAVRTIAYSGLSHSWPGTTRTNGEAEVDSDVRLAGLALAFFGQHRR
jgi:polyhydroxybutyrate depolymerase